MRLDQPSYLDERGHWRLAPAYDLTYSAGPGGAHYLDIEGEGRNPTREHVQALGRRQGLSNRAIDLVVEEVRAAVAEWPHFATEAGVTSRSRGEVLAAQEAVAGHFL